MSESKLLASLNSFPTGQTKTTGFRGGLKIEAKSKPTKDVVLVSRVDHGVDVDDATEVLQGHSRGDSGHYSPSLKSFKPEKSSTKIHFALVEADTIHKLPSKVVKKKKDLNFMSKAPRFSKVGKKVSDPDLGPGKYLGIRPTWDRKSFNVKY